MKFYLLLFALAVHQSTPTFDYFSIAKQGFGYVTKDQIDLKTKDSTKKFYSSIVSQKADDSEQEYCDFTGYYTYPFENEFRSIVKDNTIIALNEDHTNPSHRITAAKLLPMLKKAGFTHIAIEGLAMEDSQINQRKYPQFLVSGYYLIEPNFGNFIRLASKNGFKLFGYDVMGTGNREYDQAYNICNIMYEDDVKKVFIYCGHDHLVEGENTSLGKTMIQYLEDFIGEEAFTIAQTEINCQTVQTPGLCYEDYYVLKNKEGRYFSSFQDDRGLDMSILKDNRAFAEHNYELISDDFKLYNRYEAMESNNENLLVLAFDTSEKENPVPIDVIELTYKNSKLSKKPSLRLPNGKYKLLTINSKQIVVKTEIINIS